MSKVNRLKELVVPNLIMLRKVIFYSHIIKVSKSCLLSHLSLLPNVRKCCDLPPNSSGLHTCRRKKKKVEKIILSNHSSATFGHVSASVIYFPFICG
jgi:hypothetical protein